MKTLDQILEEAVTEMFALAEASPYHEYHDLLTTKHGYTAPEHGSEDNTYHHPKNGSEVRVTPDGTWSHKGINKKVVPTTGESTSSLERHLKKVASRKKANANRKWKDDTMRSMGMNKVKGALGGTYWESEEGDKKGIQEDETERPSGKIHNILTHWGYKHQSSRTLKPNPMAGFSGQQVHEYSKGDHHVSVTKTPWQAASWNLTHGNRQKASGSQAGKLQTTLERIHGTDKPGNENKL